MPQRDVEVVRVARHPTRCAPMLGAHVTVAATTAEQSFRGRGGTRTPTILRSLAPKRSVSAYSATRPSGGIESVTTQRPMPNSSESRASCVRCSGCGRKSTVSACDPLQT